MLPGDKSVVRATSAERGKTVTIMCWMNACGKYVPPAFISPRVRTRPDDTLLECLRVAEKNDWICLFEWFFTAHQRNMTISAWALFHDVLKLGRHGLCKRVRYTSKIG